MTKFGSMVPELLRNLNTKPVTILYPFEKVPTPEGFRGTPRLKPGECIGCRSCVRDCPAEAIEIEVEKVEAPAAAEGQEAPKPQKRIKVILYLDRCVHCARCVEVCPKNALYMDLEYEVANFTRDALRLVQE